MTTFFLSDDGNCIFIPFATNTVPINNIIINAMDAHLLSSPSMSAKMNVAAAPAITEIATRIQNSKLSLRSFSLLSASDTGRSSGGGGMLAGLGGGGDVGGGVEEGGDPSVSGMPSAGLSVCVSRLLLVSSDPAVGLDLLFLNLAK